MPASTDRIAELERRIAELEGISTGSTGATHRRRTAGWIGRRLLLIGLVAALMLPAGVVLGAHTFTDVPTSHRFHSDIAAIAEAGVTSGCGDGTRYCPDGLVTRGQMAAFMNRLGALAPGKAPKVNADRVDGRHANALVRLAEMRVESFQPVAADFAQYGDDLTITAPSAGFVLVTATARISGIGCSTGCGAAALLRHVQTGDDATPQAVTVEGLAASMALQGIFPVSAGVNDFRLLLDKGFADDDINVASATVTAIFVPFGSTGGSGL